jgi:Mg/Co/Ni transporter MgtE
VAKFVYHLAEMFKKETLSWAYVQPLPERIGSFKGNVKLNILKEALPEIHPVDLAEILEELSEGQRLDIFNELETEHASDTLEEMEPRAQRSLISSLDKERVADLIDEMTPAQAADVLAALATSDAEEILSLMEHDETGKIESLLEKTEHAISDLATVNYISLPPEIPAAVVIADFRRLAAVADVVDYLYVVAPDGKLLGVVSLDELLIADPRTPLAEIMTTQVIYLEEGDSIGCAKEKFDRYGFGALPVTTTDDVIRGVVTYRDIMELDY